jgi:hypothetical protein
LILSGSTKESESSSESKNVINIAIAADPDGKSRDKEVLGALFEVVLPKW